MAIARAEIVEQTETTVVPRNVVLQGDARALLRTLPDACVQTVVTSPPYWGLRSYSTDPQIWGGSSECEHEWGAQSRTPWANALPGPNGRKKNVIATRERSKMSGPFCQLCGAWRGELGQENDPDLFVAHLVEVFREVWRVLRPDGTVWVNIGDSYWTRSVQRVDGMRSVIRNYAGEVALPAWSDYAASGRARYSSGHKSLKDKDLIGVPFRFFLAMQADGWYTRSSIIWSKKNCMPEAVTDRPTNSHEHLFLFAKSQRYYYDAAAIREQAVHGANGSVFTKGKTALNGAPRAVGQGPRNDNGYRNKRSVWTIATTPYKEAHFATFPPALVEPCVLAGASSRACEQCGAPWRRVTEKQTRFEGGSGRAGPSATEANARGKWRNGGAGGNVNLKLGPVVDVTTTGWQPTCACVGNTGAGKSLVLDPFGGAGTVGVVAKRHSREYMLIELNADYCEMAERRIANERQPVLWSIA